MIVKVLVDNRREDSIFKIEHGLSLYIETPQHKCLVDVGLSDAFVFNAKEMGIDLTTIDFLFISHGHTDHVGGLPFFLELNKKARIILSSKCLSQKYFSKRRGMKDISPNINVLSHLHRFEFISSDTELDPAIRVITHIHDKFPKPKANEFLLKDSCYVGLQQDDFNHELIFSFGEKEQLVCTGCAHSGVLNILDTVKERIKLPIKTVLGGFHLLDTDDMNQYETMDEINEIASKLKKIYPLTSFYTGHCTGEAVLEKFKDTLKEQIIPFYTGMTINLNN